MSLTATTSGYGFTNTEETGAIIKLTKINEQTDYGVVTDSPNKCSMSNVTAPIGRDEIITNFCDKISNVNTLLDIANPGPTTKGIQYGTRVDATLVTTDSGDTSYEVDEPIVVQLSVRHPRSNHFSSELVSEAVQRCISAFYGNLFDNTQDHIAQLMRSALQPMPDFPA
jgi:hypothetical protein